MASAAEIAIAFNQNNDKKVWKARAMGAVVHFTTVQGMVSLQYNTEDGRFAVKFNKLVAAWGDYVKAIARSLHVVLNTLKSAGLPFDAPPTLAGMVIEAVTTEDNTVFVRWPDRRDLFDDPGYAARLEAFAADPVARSKFLHGDFETDDPAALKSPFPPVL